MIATSTRAVLAVACALALAGCSSHSGNAAPAAENFAKRVTIAPHLDLFVRCTGTGPSGARGQLASTSRRRPRAGVRQQVRRIRFCAFDRAGVTRSDVRECRCGTLERNVEDIHALIRAAALKRPVILVGHSTRRPGRSALRPQIRAGCRRARARRLAQRVRACSAAGARRRQDAARFQLRPANLAARARPRRSAGHHPEPWATHVFDPGRRAQLDDGCSTSWPETRRTRSESSRSTAVT